MSRGADRDLLARCGEPCIAGPRAVGHADLVMLGRPTSRPRRRGWFLAVLLACGTLPAACSQPGVLRTISCPVYQAPQTPMPEWPKECGGTRRTDGATSRS